MIGNQMSTGYQAFAGNQQAQWARESQERSDYLANYYSQQTPIAPPPPLTEEEKEERRRKIEEEIEEDNRKREEEEREMEREMGRRREREKERAQLCAIAEDAKRKREEKERQQRRREMKEFEEQSKKYWADPINRYKQMVFDKTHKPLYYISKILTYIIWPAGSIIIFVKIKNIIDNDNETKQLKWKKEYSNCTEWDIHDVCSENNCDWVCDEKTCSWSDDYVQRRCASLGQEWETECYGKCIVPLYDDDTGWFGWVLLIDLGYIIVLYMLYAIIYKVCMKKYDNAVKNSENPSFNIPQDEEQQALIYKEISYIGDIKPWWRFPGWKNMHGGGEDGAAHIPLPLECGPTCWKWQCPECPKCPTCPQFTDEQCEDILCKCIVPILITGLCIGLVLVIEAAANNNPPPAPFNDHN